MPLASPLSPALRKASDGSVRAGRAHSPPGRKRTEGHTLEPCGPLVCGKFPDGAFARARASRACGICGRLSSGTRKPPRRKRGGPSRSYLLCAPLGCWQASRSPASLRVSPCQYQRRVVGTTFTTTAALLRCIFIISCFLPFVKPPFYGLGMRPQARRFHPAPRISQNMGAS